MARKLRMTDAEVEESLKRYDSLMPIIQRRVLALAILQSAEFEEQLRLTAESIERCAPVMEIDALLAHARHIREMLDGKAPPAAIPPILALHDPEKCHD